MSWSHLYPWLNLWEQLLNQLPIVLLAESLASLVEKVRETARDHATKYSLRVAESIDALIRWYEFSRPTMVAGRSW